MSPLPEIAIRPDADALMRAAAEVITDAAADAVAASGRFAIALAGGATPRRLYALLAGAEYARRIPWASTHAFFGDERCVPPEHPASNYRMAHETLLGRVAMPPAQIHRIRGEDPPVAAATAYERDLRAAFATPTGPPRHAPGTCFDLILLGMGENGHTASLFPRSSVLRERERWAAADRVDAAPPERVTLTVPVINAARCALFLVSGGEKAAMLARVLEGPRDPETLPAQLVAPAGRLRWLVDAAAASALRRT